MSRSREGAISGNRVTPARPVVNRNRNRLPASAELTLLGLIVSVAIAITARHFRAVKPNSWVDHTCRVVTNRGRVAAGVLHRPHSGFYVSYYLLGWRRAAWAARHLHFSTPPPVTNLLLIPTP